MNLTLVGVSHKSAPAEVREALAVVPAGRFHEELKKRGCAEAVVLSTCNRFELYLCGEDGARDARWAVGFLEELAGARLDGHAYSREADEAVRHLFEVAAGLDSLVVGETEILGQVKTAYEAARLAGMTGKRSNVLFQRALFVGKKIRSATAIAVGQTSVASVAVQLAESIFGDLSRREVLILGAGQMAELSAKHLLSKKVARVTVANRTWERGRDLAQRMKARAIRWEEFPGALSEADVVIASTGSERPVLTREIVAASLLARQGRSLFVIDIAMPRDVEDAVHGLEHVYLYRLEDLEGIVARNLASRGGEIERARQLAREKASEFCAWLDSAASGREVSLKHAPRLEGGKVAG